MTSATQIKCACENCNCPVSEAKAIKLGEKVYCSEVCAQGHPDGKGCGHAGCNCG